MANTLLSLLLILPLVLLPVVQAHFTMHEPCARGNPACYSRYGRLDYDVESPLNYEDEPEIGGDFPCKGLPAGPSVARYRAGSNISVKLSGSNAHDGGHCQFTVSPDNGRTWIVLRTVTENCLRGRGSGPYYYDVKLPSTTPGGRIIFAWTFVNREGKKEFYMSCSDIDVDGPQDGVITGPELLVFRLSPKQSGGRKFEPLGEWKYGGDNGVSRLNRRPVISAGRRGRVSGGSARPSTPAKTPTSNKRPAKNSNSRKRPAPRRQQRPSKRPRHDDDDDEDDCDDDC